MSVDLLEGHRRDLGGFFVNRVLPSARHRAVGPFVFFDSAAAAPRAGADRAVILEHGETS